MSKFLGSHRQLAQETTLEEINDKLTSVTIGSGTVSVSNLSNPHPVSVSSATISDVNFTTTQTDDLNTNITNTTLQVQSNSSNVATETTLAALNSNAATIVTNTTDGATETTLAALNSNAATIVTNTTDAATETTLGLVSTNTLQADLKLEEILRKMSERIITNHQFTKNAGDFESVFDVEETGGTNIKDYDASEYAYSVTSDNTGTLINTIYTSKQSYSINTPKRFYLTYKVIHNGDNMPLEWEIRNTDANDYFGLRINHDNGGLQEIIVKISQNDVTQDSTDNTLFNLDTLSDYDYDSYNTLVMECGHNYIRLGLLEDSQIRWAQETVRADAGTNGNGWFRPMKDYKVRLCMRKAAAFLDGNQWLFKDMAVTSLYEEVREPIERMRIANPIRLFSSHFPVDTQPNYWKYELTSGAGISESLDASNYTLDITTTNSTSGQFEMSTFQRFDCNNVSNRYSITVTPNLTGISSVSRVQVGLSGAQSGENMLVTLEFGGDDLEYINVQRGLSSASFGNSEWKFHSNILGARSDKLTIFFEFNNHVIRVGQVYEGKDRYLHELFKSSTSEFPFFQNWRPYVFVRQSAADTGFTCEIHDVLLIQDAKSDWLGTPRSFYQTGSTTYSGGSNYAVTGIRYDSAITRADEVPVYVTGFDLTPHASAGTYSLTLIKNPTIASAPTWTSETDSPVETLDGDSSNTFTVGTPIYSIVVDDDTGRVLAALPNPIPLNKDDELVVCIDVQTGFTGHGCINWTQY